MASASNRQVATIVQYLGFTQTGASRLFDHPRSEYVIEFPSGPLLLGDAAVRDWAELETPAGKIQILTPVQGVRDRLAAYFQWSTGILSAH